MVHEGHEFLEGAIDVYVHAAPDRSARRSHDIDLARELQQAGLRAAVHRHHFAPTGSRSELTKIVTGFDVRGAFELNASLGGLNADIVEHEICNGAGWIVFPTLSSRHFLSGIDRFPDSVKALVIDAPVEVVDDDGALLPAVHDVLDVIASADAVVGTGYLSAREQLAVARAAQEHGVSRIVVSNPQLITVQLDLDTVRALLELKPVLLEVSVVQLMAETQGKDLFHFGAELLRLAGAGRAVLSTDSGMATFPPPAETLALGCHRLLQSGLEATEIQRMTHETPAILLDV